MSDLATGSTPNADQTAIAEGLIEVPDRPGHASAATGPWVVWSRVVERWLAGKQRLFLAISLLLVISDFLFIAINFESGRQALQQEWEEAWQRANATIELAVEGQANTMLMLARGYAADPEIQQLFLAGREAVIAEGGGEGGKKAARARQTLYDRMAPAWNRITAEFRVRQLHFHLGPGSLSFLRVHKPQRFGDRMDDLRFIIVDTIADGTPRTGFETGRVYSGIRGVTPVTAMQPNGERIIVGALEAGTSFETMMRLMDHALGAGVAVLLTKQHVEETMWDEFVGKHFTDDMGECACVIESRSRDEILTFVRKGLVFTEDPPPHAKTVELGDRHFSVLQFPLRDYLGDRHPERADVGRIVVWHDITDRIASFRSDQFINIAFALTALTLIELLMFFGVRFVTRARDAAEAGNRAKTNFLGTMNHEFRTPLNAVIGFSDLLQSGAVGPLMGKQGEYIEDIGKSGRHLLKNIDRILHYQKIESGEFGANKELLDIADDVRRILDRRKEAGENAGVEISVSLPDTLELHANRDAVEHAISEILDNAVAVSPEGGTVHIDLTDSGGEASVVITDGGPGFPPDKLALMARPFTKSQDAFEKADGFGMGLATARALVLNQDGRIEIENMPDGGARVTMHFPHS